MAHERAQLRFEAYDSIIISPHMDDAAFSCGGRMLLERRAGKRVLVVTVFGTGAEEAREGEGRRGAFANYAKRKREELEVMGALDADFVWLNRPELLYRRSSLGELVRYVFPFLRLSQDALHTTLHRELVNLGRRYLAPGGLVHFPFAVGFHPDHRILFDIGRRLHAERAFPIRFYEDIPYALTPALRVYKLRYLGEPATPALLRDTREINYLLFWRFGAWSRLTWLMVFGYLAGSQLLRALLGARDAAPDQPAPALHETDISALVEERCA